MTTVVYFFQDEPSQPEGSFQIPSKHSVFVHQICEHFPFYGRFHFRSKYPPDAQSKSFSWLDLLDSEEPVPSNGGVIYLKVLQIPVNDDALSPQEKQPIEVGGADTAVHSGNNLDFTDITQVRERVDKVSQDLKKTTEKVTRSTGKFLGKLWKSATQTVESLSASVTNQRIPSSKAVTQLSTLEMTFSSPFANGFEEHEQLLVRLWESCLPRKKFEAVSDKWKLLGFQRDDPRLDLRGGGVLSLKCLVFFTTEYKQKAVDMIKSQSKRASNTYPFAAVGVNLTLLLGELTMLRDRKFEKSAASFWGVFEHPDAFYEVFCFLFRYLDHLWTDLRADRKQFGKIIGKVKEVAHEVLQMGPSSLNELMEMAGQCGYLY